MTTPARNFFKDLFVLEMANNHWGDVERGKRIIADFAQVARFNGTRAAMKFQFRDVDSFIHKDWRDRDDVRYIKKTIDTQLSKDELGELVDYARQSNFLVGATPFDEASVAICEEFKLDFVKVASSDINDWFLIERIAKTRLPVSFSTGGSTLKDIDDIVTFFERRNIPLAINHCVSIYPTEDSELDLNQIDFLRDRYPGHAIGLSSHEYKDWTASVQIAYAKGARTFERHIDIEADGIPVSAYCTLPEQCDEWFRAYQRAIDMCGAPGTERRSLPEKEIRYLDGLVRGVYAKRRLQAGHKLGDEDVYLAIPLQKGQISCRELMRGEVLTETIEPDEPVRIEAIDSPYARVPGLRRLIAGRGVDPQNPVEATEEPSSGGGLRVVDSPAGSKGA
jgi:N-acetylneuraminate synthase